MKNVLFAFFLCVSLLLSNTSFAQDINLSEIPNVQLQPNEIDVGAALSPMKITQRAPFSGVLLSPQAVAEIIVKLNSINDVVNIETTRVREELLAQHRFEINDLNIRHTSQVDVLNVQLKAREQQINVLNETIKKIEDSQSNTPMWATVGFGSGVGVTLLLVLAITQVI